MTDTTSGAFPTLYRHDNFADIAKHSPAPSAYESESPLAAHSSTTNSSRLSGSYEPSQVGSYMEEANAHMAQMQLNESTHQQHHHQRPQLAQLVLPQNMNMATSHAQPNAIHAPYTNYSTYPNYYVGSPVVADHASYPYSPIHQTPEQHHAVPGRPMYYPTPISPPPLHASATYPHPHAEPPRRASFGIYYPFDLVSSPVTPYAHAYPQHTSMMPQPTSIMYTMPQTPTQQYPNATQISPAPITRQTRPAVSSPLRPQPSAPTPSHLHSTNTRRSANTLYASASSYGHQSSLGQRSTFAQSSSLGQQASVLANRYQREHRDAPITSGAAAATSTRSAVLTDFKNQKFKRFELKDIFGHSAEFSTDQHGSRFIQQKLDLATPDERQIVFDEIMSGHHALRLMLDVFGNYVIQKLFEYGTTAQKAILCSEIDGNVMKLSLDMYGCRVIQKALECVSPQQQTHIVTQLESQILVCVKDANGNHVIQKVLERVVAERMTIVNAFADNVYALATHPYGCRVLQRCFEHVSPDMVTRLLEELHQNAIALMQDQFGNYVIQFILERGSALDRNRMIDALTGQLATMSRHKFASNVCEKAMAVSDPIRRRLIIEEMLLPTSSGIPLVSIMMKDQYANYVLQKAINLVDGELLDALVAVVVPQLVSMRRHPGTTNSKQLTSIERLLREKGFSLDVSPLHLAVSPSIMQDDVQSGSPTP